MPRFPSDGLGPAPDPGVVAELKRIDKNLYVVWRNFAFDATTPLGDTLVYVRDQPGSQGQVGKPVEEPGWRICLAREREPHDAVLFTWLDEECKPIPLDKRVAQKIRSDMARHMSPQEIIQHVKDARERDLFLREKERQQEVADIAAANARKIREAMEHANSTTREKAFTPSGEKRDAIIYGYDGQPVRGTPGQVRKTAKEAGYELPREEGDE